uniref:DUF805 domain-containing protein n=1 Tax=Pararhizobium sp. IMCC3301 TaxID=3067904 RepID=UPI002740556D|nr:DUF805 domain-containing protein [Pararhizobium sp. IMCC3301]
MADLQQSDKNAGTNGVLWALFRFSGRINREEYWWANAVLLGISLVTFRVVFGDSVEMTQDGQMHFPETLMPSFMLVLLASLYVTFAISVKRLHDLGWPGIVAAVFLFPAIGLFAFVVLGLLKGQNQSNKYGPAPPR